MRSSTRAVSLVIDVSTLSPTTDDAGTVTSTISGLLGAAAGSGSDGSAAGGAVGVDAAGSRVPDDRSTLPTDSGASVGLVAASRGDVVEGARREAEGVGDDSTRRAMVFAVAGFLGAVETSGSLTVLVGGGVTTASVSETGRAAGDVVTGSATGVATVVGGVAS
jgi:hypothetical protein